MKLSTALWAILVVAIWGLNPTLSKLGMIDMPTFAFLSLRYLLTGLIFLPFARVQKGQWLALFLFALYCNVILNGLSYVAFLYLQPAAATLLLQMGVPINVLMAYLFAQEKITRRQMFGIIMALGGVVAILGFPEINLFGAALIMLSNVFWGFCQLIFKKHKELQPSALIAFGYLFALPFVAVISLWYEPPLQEILAQAANLKFVLVMAFQVFGMSFAVVMWQRLVARNGISKISSFVMLEIVFSVLAGYIIFNDTINWMIALGIVLITSGVFFVSQGGADDSQK